MGFFDGASRLPEPWPRGTPWDPPAGEFPCAVATGALVLARTEAVAVAVTAIWAFTAGFEFWVKAQFRHPGPALERLPDDQSLHISVQFADGKKAANVTALPEPAGSVPSGLILNPRSFGVSRQHLHRSYWVWPLPPPGPVSFACEWAAFDIPQAHTDTDGQLILDAARRSVQIWAADHG